MKITKRILIPLCLCASVVGVAFAQDSAVPAPQFSTRQLLLPLQVPPQPSSSVTAQRVGGSGGPATYYYWVVPQFLIGAGPISQPAQVGGVDVTLSASAKVRVSWAAVTGATSYDVLRTTSATPPSGACNCAVATSVTGLSADDTSNTLSAYTVNTLNPDQFVCTLSTLPVSAGVAHTFLTCTGLAPVDLNGGSASGCPGTTSDTQIFFNQAGNCGGSPDLLWQYSTNTLVAGFTNGAILNWFAANGSQTEYSIDSDGAFYFDGDHTGFSVKYNPTGQDMFFTSTTPLIFQNEGLGDTNFIELNTTSSFPSVLLHTGSGSSALPQLELSSANAHAGDTILQSDIIQLSNADGGQGATHGFSVDVASSNSGSTSGGAGAGYFSAQSVNTQGATALHAKASSGDHTKEFALEIETGAFRFQNACDSSTGSCTDSPIGTATIAAGATSRTVGTGNHYVSTSSKIILTRDNSLGTLLGVTCNTQSSLVLGMPYVSARSTATSFTVTLDVAPTTNPLCFTWQVID